MSAAEPKTNAVALGGRALFKSDAALAVLGRSPVRRWATVLRPVPRSLRAWFYDRVARNRYGLFGRAGGCMVPTPDLSARFLTGGGSGV